MGIGIAAVAQTLAWEQVSSRVADAHEVIERLDEVSLGTLAAQESARRFVAAPDPRELAHAREELSMARERGAEIGNLVGGDTLQRRSLQSVRQLVEQEAAALLLGSDATQEQVRVALAGLDLAGLDANLRSSILEMEAQEREVLRQRQDMQSRSASLSRVLFSVAAAFSLILIIVAGGRMSADSRRRGTAEARLAARDEQYRQVVELAGDIIYRTDRHGRFTFCNQAFITSLHYSRPELIGRSFLKLVRQDKRRETRRFYVRHFAEKQKSVYLELPVVDAHGRERWIGQNVQLLLEGGRLIGLPVDCPGDHRAEARRSRTGAQPELRGADCRYYPGHPLCLRSG